ncbi:MAG: MCE family protein [Chloroflexi bacterium]|nr:MAG: MCE family protein [Chloroflexota bacterium]
MRSRWNFPIYIGYLIFSLLVIGYIIAQVGIAAPWSHQFSVTAKFTNAADILVNNEVFMNGTKIGHIGAVDVVNGEAKVQLVIDNGHALPLHSDASASTCSAAAGSATSRMEAPSRRAAPSRSPRWTRCWPSSIPRPCSACSCSSTRWAMRPSTTVRT